MFFFIFFWRAFAPKPHVFELNRERGARSADQCSTARSGACAGKNARRFQALRRKPPLLAASNEPASHMEMLLELGRNAVELAVEGAANGVHRCNDHH